MSEDNKEVKEAREKFVIEEVNEEFNPIGSFKLITSDELGKLASELFKGIFIDCEGVKFNPGGKNEEPTYSLIFNHGKYDEATLKTEGKVLGIKSALVETNDSSDPLEKMRMMYKITNSTTRYLATDDLSDVVEKLIAQSQKYYNFTTHKVNWKNIMIEFSEQARSGFYSSKPIQFTAVEGISAKKLVQLIYGTKSKEKDGNKDEYDYSVSVLMAAPNGYFVQNNQPSNWILQINRASGKEVTELYNKFGYNTSSSTIIR